VSRIDQLQFVFDEIVLLTSAHLSRAHTDPYQGSPRGCLT
jgi:hypothetical protein